jgi:uncharacterized damage-inducible protein DinB
MKDPAVLFFIDKWLVSTKDMKSFAKGWYLNLILYQYDKGSLPNDIEELANLCDVRISEFEQFKQVWEQVLKQKFKANDKGGLENEMAAEILRKREAFKEKRSEAGKIGYITKVAMTMYKGDYGFIDYVKEEINLEAIDTKDKQMLKQVLKQMHKLYINVDEDKDNINNKKINEILNQLSPESKELIETWLQYKKEKNQPYKPTGLKSFITQLKNLSKGDRIKAKKIIQQSMANNWSGIFELKEDNKNPKPEVLKANPSKY